MSVILLLIVLSLGIAAGFLVAFIWAVRSGQYEDTGTPPLRVLLDEPGRPGGPRPFPSTHNPKIEHEH
jgi:cbb3-type cytochrome oxidase maturation protein